MASAKVKSLINWKNGAGVNMTGFVNTGFATPDQIIAAAEEMLHLADQAKKADRLVRVWCDSGEKSGKPYMQIMIDKWTKKDRVDWLTNFAAKRKAERNSKA